jgi:hypothetical protein
MIFAEQLPDPGTFSSIGWVIVILASLAFGANAVMELVSRLRGSDPEPPNGQLHQSVKQLNARIKVLEDWRAQLMAKLDEDKNQILMAGEHRAEKIHDRINDVLEAVSELRGQVNEISKNCKACDS